MWLECWKIKVDAHLSIFRLNWLDSEQFDRPSYRQCMYFKRFVTPSDSSETHWEYLIFVLGCWLYWGTGLLGYWLCIGAGCIGIWCWGIVFGVLVYSGASYIGLLLALGCWLHWSTVYIRVLVVLGCCLYWGAGCIGLLVVFLCQLYWDARWTPLIRLRHTTLYVLCFWLVNLFETSFLLHRVWRR